MRNRHQQGPAGRRRLAVAVAILDLVIIVGLGAHLAGGVATGTSLAAFAESDPVRLLGTPLGETSCPSVPLSVGDGNTVICPDWTAITSPAGVVVVVSIYGPGSSVVDTFEGALPLGLRWGDGMASAWVALGRPDRITSVYGTPTLVYMFDTHPYGSLELRFDSTDHLVRVNASLVH
jgi:hypothetical protein